MLFALIKNSVVVNAIVAESDFANALTGFDYVIRYDNLDAHPKIGDTYDPNTGIFTTPALPFVFNESGFLQDLYVAMQEKMVGLAPYLAAFQDMIGFSNWTGIKTYLAQLVTGNILLQADSDVITALILAYGIDLSKF